MSERYFCVVIIFVLHYICLCKCSWWCTKCSCYCCCRYFSRANTLSSMEHDGTLWTSTELHLCRKFQLTTKCWNGLYQPSANIKFLSQKNTNKPTEWNALGSGLFTTIAPNKEPEILYRWVYTAYITSHDITSHHINHNVVMKIFRQLNIRCVSLFK